MEYKELFRSDEYVTRLIKINEEVLEAFIAYKDSPNLENPIEGINRLIHDVDTLLAEARSISRRHHLRCLQSRGS